MPDGCKIFVTGGAGFIGSNLVDSLVLKNDVTVMDNLSSGRISNIASHEGTSGFKFVNEDLLSGPDKIACHLQGHNMVFHLAANPDVKAGTTDTWTHIEQNVLCTRNLLEAMRLSGVGRIAFTSTSTVYGEASVIPTPEDYGPLKPISLYGASKLACEALISSYCHTFDMQAWIFRFANIVGFRGSHGVIVDFIKKLQSNPSELEILGSGEQRKSYLEVGDCVFAMLKAVDCSHGDVNIFNIGSQDWIDVIGIADVVVEEMGLSNVSYRFTGGVEGRGWKGDVKTMLLSTDLIRSLGWQERYRSRDAISVAANSLLRSQ
jgi:UDP-glucose 4-epimerase